MGCASGAPALYRLEVFLELYSLLEHGCSNASSLWGKAEVVKKGAKAVDIVSLGVCAAIFPRVLKG